MRLENDMDNFSLECFDLAVEINFALKQKGLKLILYWKPENFALYSELGSWSYIVSFLCWSNFNLPDWFYKYVADGYLE